MKTDVQEDGIRFVLDGKAWPTCNDPFHMWFPRGLLADGRLNSDACGTYMFMVCFAYNQEKGVTSKEMRIHTGLGQLRYAKVIKLLEDTGWISRERVRTPGARLGGSIYRLHHVVFGVG